MSEIKVLDKLRKYHLCFKNEKTTFYNSTSEIADEIEAEIAANYMRLPCDTEGVPIHLGDIVEGELLYGNTTVKGTVTTYHIHDNDEPDTVYIKVDCGNGTWTIKELRIERCRHIKSRTLEDVLNDFAYKACDLNVSQDDVSRYADEIRELFGGDA